MSSFGDVFKVCDDVLSSFSGNGRVHGGSRHQVSVVVDANTGTASWGPGTGSTKRRRNVRAGGPPKALTAFYVDCSARSPLAASPECRRLKDAFLNKEVTGIPLKCGELMRQKKIKFLEENEDDETGGVIDPHLRAEYFWETNTGMWYKCCEQPHLEAGFAYPAPLPQVTKP